MGAAVLDESSLDRRFDPRHLGEVYIAFKLLSGTGLVVEIFKSVARLHLHPGLFRVAGIDKHTFGHKGATPERSARAQAGQLSCLPAAARKFWELVGSTVSVPRPSSDRAPSNVRVVAR